MGNNDERSIGEEEMINKGRKYVKPKCPRCKTAMRYISLINYNSRTKLGYYCSTCNSVKLKPGIKLICDPIFKGLNEVF